MLDPGSFLPIWLHWINHPFVCFTITLTPSCTLLRIGDQSWTVGRCTVTPKSCNTVSHLHGQQSAVVVLGKFSAPQATSVPGPAKWKQALCPRSQSQNKINAFGDVPLPIWKARAYEKAKPGSPPGGSPLGLGVLSALTSVSMAKTEDSIGFKGRCQDRA